MRLVLLSIPIVLFLSGCAGSAGPGEAKAPPDDAAAVEASEAANAPRVVDALFPDARRTLDIPTLIAMAPLAEGAPVAVTLIGSDENCSHHVVALRDDEPLHRHDHHDLLAIILRGHGRMWIEGEEQAVGPDSITYVPRGAAHSLRNDADEPIVGYVVYWPPYDGQDRVLVEWPWP